MLLSDRLRFVLQKKTLAEGKTSTNLPNVNLFKSFSPSEPFAVEYKPCICIAAQGRKQVLFGDKKIEYNENSFFVTTLAVPMIAQIIEATAEKPLLLLVVTINIEAAGKLLSETSILPRRKTSAVVVSNINDKLRDSAARLIEVACDPTDSKILGGTAEREFFYRIFSTEQGDYLREIVLRGAHRHRINRTIKFIQENYSRQISIRDIAKNIGVSSSTLHHMFKPVVSLSPIQYLKQIRLHRAQTFMISDGLNVSEAAFRVGYGSLSHFSRDFKQLFGRTPSQALSSIQV